MNIKRIFSYLSPVDFISILFLLFLTALNVVFHSRVEAWLIIITINICVIIGIILLAYIAEKKRTKLLIGLHRWYCYPIILFVFKELYLMVRPIHPVDYDWLFIAIDQWMFGVNPTQWFAQFAHPLITEILQISYFSYYFLFIMLGVELYRRFPIEEFDRGAFFVVYGFYLSYIGYFLLPAVGPRFMLHDFYAIDKELPGLLLTTPMREFINIGESITSTMPNAIDYVQRNVFPSGHTQLTLVVVYLAYYYRLKTKWLITIIAVLLIIATVYLRYHYVIDLIGGFIFFLLTIWSGKKIQTWRLNQLIKNSEMINNQQPQKINSE